MPTKWYDGHSYPTTVSDLPKDGPFNAALCEEWYSHDDGYGGQSSGYALKLIAFETPKAMEEWALEQVKSESRKKFQLIRINPIHLEVKTVLTIKE